MSKTKKIKRLNKRVASLDSNVTSLKSLNDMLSRRLDSYVNQDQIRNTVHWSEVGEIPDIMSTVGLTFSEREWYYGTMNKIHSELVRQTQIFIDINGNINYSDIKFEIYLNAKTAAYIKSISFYNPSAVEIKGNLMEVFGHPVVEVIGQDETFVRVHRIG